MLLLILDGSINGARLPWQMRIDTRIDRDLTLNLGEGDKSKSYQMNVYFQILNLLNSQNITNVYRFTGNPNDDGYLNAAQFQQDIGDIVYIVLLYHYDCSISKLADLHSLLVSIR